MPISEIYIRANQYSALATLMSCHGLSSFYFPVFPVTAGDLFYTLEDVELRLPACLILLSTQQDYDKDHYERLNTVEFIMLRNIPERQGWWRIIE
jgi:hypothetical protein